MTGTMGWYCGHCGDYHETVTCPNLLSTAGNGLRYGRVEFAPNPEPRPIGAVPAGPLNTSAIESKLDRVIDLLEELISVQTL